MVRVNNYVIDIKILKTIFGVCSKRVGDIKISVLSAGLVEKQNQDDTRLMMNDFQQGRCSIEIGLIIAK